MIRFQLANGFEPAGILMDYLPSDKKSLGHAVLMVRTDRGDYIDYFVKVKQAEWSEYHEQVTEWETNRYLGLF